MIKIRQAVIVEGKYDKIRLSSIVDTLIITTDGFGVFKSEEKRALIKRLAKERGIIVLSDPDGAGGVIRSYIKNLAGGNVINLYVPQVEGKEKRKKTGSKEGLLGVEGIDSETIEKLFMKYADRSPERRKVTLTDFFLDGINGTSGASEKRRAFCKAAELPEKLNAKTLLDAVNTLYSYDEYREILNKLPGDNDND